MASALPSSTTKLRLPDAVTHDLSVVVVSYNTREMTLACVRSVLEHKGALSVEVIVVDNQSSDGSSAALRDAFPDITVIDAPANGGFAYGNAIGFEQAHGRYVLLLNPDTQVYAGGLEDSIAYMEENPQTAIMGPLVRLEDGSQQSSMIRFLSLTALASSIVIPNRWLRKTTWFGDIRYADHSRAEVNRVDAVSGCFMMVRREVLAKVGGLDTRFFMYGEETEWCHRIRAVRWEIEYNPAVEILHHGAASTEHMSAWKAVEMARGQLLFLRFTRGAGIAWFAALLMTLRDLLRAPAFIALALVGRAKRAETWWARLRFVLKSLISLPKGQSITLPQPGDVAK